MQETINICNIHGGLMKDRECSSSSFNRAAHRLFIILGLVMLICAAAAPVSVNAAVKKGFVKEKGSYYYYESGKKVKGFKTINSAKYYFDANGRMKTGWCTIGKDKYFFQSNGKMTTGWKTEGTKRYYFTSDGKMVKGRYLYDKKKRTYRYFAASGQMVRGWYTVPDGNKIYFSSNPSYLGKDGIKQFGFVKVGNFTYYFKSGTGYLTKGWITRKSDGARFYLDPARNGALVVNTTKVLDGVTYIFDSKGVSSIKLSPVGTVTRAAGAERTIKNYLLNALQPCGRVLYIWGGGWNQGNIKGVPSSWTDWYNSQGSSFNYNNYRDLSAANRAKGLDCSGFVGWAAYQIMQSSSYAGYGYTVVSGSVGGSYIGRGWGSILTQSQLAASGYKMYPGDIGYDANHVWIIVGQCKDKSCVVLHSTPQAGVQLSGTPTPSGNYDSRAVQVCERYMRLYPGFSRFPYRTSCGNFITRSNYFRWNRSTLADPDGFMNMNAEQVLSNLYR